MISTAEKKIEVVQHGFATPLHINKNRKTFSGAIYDCNGQIIVESQRTKCGDNEWSPEDPENIIKPNRLRNINGNSLYLGHYTGHYGHFLLESLARFWVLLEEDISIKKFDHFIFHPFLHKAPYPEDFSPARICFGCFGIDSKKIIILDDYHEFETIAVPQPLFEINHKVHKDMIDVYNEVKRYGVRLKSSRVGFINQLKGWTNAGDLKLYVSRRKAKGYHPMLNELDVEKIFINQGYKIFHPEKWTFQQQLAIFNRAKIIAGVEGSGLHNSVFMGQETTVISIGTPRNPSGKILNQYLCNRLSGVKGEYIEFKGNINHKNRAIYDIDHLRSELLKIIGEG